MGSECLVAGGHLWEDHKVSTVDLRVPGRERILVDGIERISLVERFKYFPKKNLYTSQFSIG